MRREKLLLWAALAALPLSGCPEPRQLGDGIAVSPHGLGARLRLAGRGKAETEGGREASSKSVEPAEKNPSEASGGAGGSPNQTGEAKADAGFGPEAPARVNEEGEREPSPRAPPEAPVVPRGS